MQSQRIRRPKPKTRALAGPAVHHLCPSHPTLPHQQVPTPPPSQGLPRTLQQTAFSSQQECPPGQQQSQHLVAARGGTSLLGAPATLGLTSALRQAAPVLACHSSESTFYRPGTVPRASQRSLAKPLHNPTRGFWSLGTPRHAGAPAPTDWNITCPQTHRPSRPFLDWFRRS